MSRLILFADDDPLRTALAYQRMNPEDQNNTIWAQTVEECINTLWDYREVLKLVSFGHDFNGLKFMNTKSEFSGTEIVRWLENLSKKDEIEFKRFKDMKFIVHSWNIGASLRMVERMKKLELNIVFKPFGTGDKDG